MTRTWLLSLVTVLAVAAGSYAWFATMRGPELPEGILYANGHIGSALRYYMEIILRIFLKGAGWHELWQEAVMLAMIGAALYAAALLAFRRRIA